MRLTVLADTDYQIPAEEMHSRLAEAIAAHPDAQVALAGGWLVLVSEGPDEDRTPADQSPLEPGETVGVWLARQGEPLRIVGPARTAEEALRSLREDGFGA